ncbi:ras-domain-containing protein [Pseudovirgaria hyperparasitica]|uniref:Ras-domain-containing protein n=1 Tax=Pseudovirgaria hyperparasitica TaxID=470096 RepID=A0A6A6WGE7_9PEZI|nr:ras-domain-containing protein [Pseudovirgaria hyperparasitica]KAF2760707.1 ras-domain-containing protein [Pseudovirgaria hyperparasitica]
MDEDSRISITICGDGGCGKSSITLRLVRSEWTHEYDPTIEDSYSVTRVIDGKTYHLNITDTAGQEEYRGLWATSNLKSDAFLLVYDITSPMSLDGLQYFTDMLEIETEHRLDTDGVPPVKIVTGNKCDLQTARQIRSQQGLEWARARKCGFMETSAREMVNIEETFALLVRRVVESRKIHAMGGAAAFAKTQPIAPTSEKKHLPDIEQVHREARPSLWRRVKCW